MKEYRIPEESLDELKACQKQMSRQVDKDGYFKNGYVEEWNFKLIEIIEQIEKEVNE